MDKIIKREDLKNQVTERLAVSIQYEGNLNFVVDLTDGCYVASIVKSIERNQLEAVGLSTPDCNPKEIAMLKDIITEMLGNGEIAKMIASVYPKKVVIAPYEGFNHKQFLYDWVSFNVNDDMSVYFINENDNTEVA